MADVEYEREREYQGQGKIDDSGGLFSCLGLKPPRHSVYNRTGPSTPRD